MALEHSFLQDPAALAQSVSNVAAEVPGAKSSSNVDRQIEKFGRTVLLQLEHDEHDEEHWGPVDGTSTSFHVISALTVQNRNIFFSFLFSN